MEASVSTLRNMGLVFDGNASSESISIDKLTEQLKKHLTERMNPKTKQKISMSGSKMGSVFISFNSQYTHSFVSNIVDALIKEGIDVAMNDNTTSPSDFETGAKINNSDIALVILSEEYTASRSCMNELMAIVRNLDKEMLMAIPIFYKVKPRDVKNHMGRFGKCFKELTKSTDEDTILRWQNAIQHVVDIMGLTYDESSGRSEISFISEIIRPIKQILDNISTRN